MVQAAFSTRAARPAKANRARLVCRAEEKSIAKVRLGLGTVAVYCYAVAFDCREASICPAAEDSRVDCSRWHTWVDLQVDRPKDAPLYVGASQSSLAYLDGTLPGVSRPTGGATQQ